MRTHIEMHNRFKSQPLSDFSRNDPHLVKLAKLKLKHPLDWWRAINLDEAGIYILTGGRQVGKSTSCKLLIEDCLKKKRLPASHIFYLPCDQIFDAKELSEILTSFLKDIINDPFLIIIDEVTFVNNWDRVIKAHADSGFFQNGVCLLTGSDSVILKEAAMRFPGRRGQADQVDYHLYPLTFCEYVTLREKNKRVDNKKLGVLFNDYLQCGGYLRAINDLEMLGEVSESTYKTYEQWVRGDFLKQGKNEQYLIEVLSALFSIGVSSVSYTTLSNKMGLMKKDTLIDYTRLLERMDVLFSLQAFDQNKKVGFPRKDRKFHFVDPFIYRTIMHWLAREGKNTDEINESVMVEAVVASHCQRFYRTFYFKGQGEVDVIWIKNKVVCAAEVKWANQIRPNDLKAIKQFSNGLILGKQNVQGHIDEVALVPVYQFLNKFE